MEDYQSLRDRLPAYLTGELDKKEQEELERALQSNEQLASDLLDLRQLQSGLEMLSRMEDDHIAAHLLVQYAERPDRLGDDERQMLERHLEQCDECRDELTMCRGAVSPDTLETPVVRRIWEWLTFPRLVSPAWGAIVLILLAVPAIYLGYENLTMSDSTAQVFRLRAGVSRGVEQRQSIMVTEGATVISLQLGVPTISNRTYGVEVYKHDSLLITAAYHLEPTRENSIDVSFARSLLPDGNYRIDVLEYDKAPMPVDTFAFELQVESTP